MQLSRILTAPLVVDVRPGAVAGLGALLADRRIATEGRVAVAVGPSQGDSVLADLDLGSAKVFRVEDSTVFLNDISSQAFLITVDYFTLPVAQDEFNALKQRINLEVLRLTEKMELSMAGASTMVTVTQSTPPAGR